MYEGTSGGRGEAPQAAGTVSRFRMNYCTRLCLFHSDAAYCSLCFRLKAIYLTFILWLNITALVGYTVDPIFRLVGVNPGSHLCFEGWLGITLHIAAQDTVWSAYVAGDAAWTMEALCSVIDCLTPLIFRSSECNTSKEKLE